MNIRIGNDVKIKMPISDIGNININNICDTRCVFKLSNNTNPLFHQSTKYTIRDYGNLSYNVLPNNGICNYTDLHSHGFVDYTHYQYISKCVIENNYIIASLPAECQRFIGTYDCFFDVKVKETGWDDDDIHSYRSSYFDIFTLVDDNSGSVGSIVINTTNTNGDYTYVFSLTDSEINDLEGNYSQILPTSDKFEILKLEDSCKLVKVIGSNKKICFISNNDDLLMYYNNFMLPMNMYKLDNGSYLYKSCYTYSNIELPITISITGILNEISQMPSQDQPSQDNPSDPTPTTPPSEDVIDNINTYNNNVITLYGNISNGILSVKGAIISTSNRLSL